MSGSRGQPSAASKDVVAAAIDRLQIRSSRISIAIAVMAGIASFLVTDRLEPGRPVATGLAPALIAILCVYSASQLVLLAGKRHAAVHVRSIALMRFGRLLDPQMTDVLRAHQRMNEGQLEAAEAAVGSIAEHDPRLRFERALLSASLRLRRGEDADIAGLRPLLDEIPDARDRWTARAEIALEEAREALAHGEDWMRPFDLAHAEIRQLRRSLPLWRRVLDPGSRVTDVWFLAAGAVWVVFVVVTYALSGTA